MKKFFVTLLLIFLFSSVSYGAVSQDIYVRQDVFDAKMEALFERLHGEIVEIKNDVRSLKTEVTTMKTEIKEMKTEISDMKGDIKALSAQISGLEKTTASQIEGLAKTTSSQIEGLAKTTASQIEGLTKATSSQIEGLTRIISRETQNLDKRIDDLRNGLYLWLVVIGVILAYEPAKKFLQAREERRKNTPSFTLEDVEKLIDSKLSKLSQIYDAAK